MNNGPCSKFVDCECLCCRYNKTIKEDAVVFELAIEFDDYPELRIIFDSYLKAETIAMMMNYSFSIKKADIFSYMNYGDFEDRDFKSCCVLKMGEGNE